MLKEIDVFQGLSRQFQVMSKELDVFPKMSQQFQAMSKELDVFRLPVLFLAGSGRFEVSSKGSVGL